ncbi:TetR family transcriptional regulator [Streptomyces botrytidirepellens]|uniref:TetR/AcrR family transcriptional regulator n=1 Tax=Streptomyces botrytidirepellens TaxID=2486417 RepID=A0A3M8VKQ5_9ACTN|nr:TetR family transcriptional regulator [Streptomyces botrytidirepellens]RNG18150.1 TetR/AcrR family transcriptional regulator [Streptomyces botrytidirepellens]
MPPPETPLTPDRVLEATEDVLRRFGPAKATVVDVARALGVSHGSVYRHFRTKAALREAVTERWLDQAHDELSAIARAKGPAAERLREWLATLFAAKRRKAGDDPELFATYLSLAAENSGTVARHIETMVGDLTKIVESGLASGEFTTRNARKTAQALWSATAHFHDPVYANEWSDPGAELAFTDLFNLLLNGLRA